ncbi:nitrite transporter NirC [Evansella caseinilytica]|uniref:Nitrite transporter NirC n=1 Tax=Evansella caseinilytica TaxID=1503961 RepID=A0A1H3GG76_9BACI|nr:formate/nitrite transporter family protein [Evansella caseinilytica]SDY02296.1 nitrite transporter NirC [Evansella caseinilytica]
MESDALLKVKELALKKQKVYHQSRLAYLLRSVLAGIFVGFGVIIAFKTGNLFYTDGSPLAYPMAAITFGSAIILIAYGGGDLFTGNTFYYTYTSLRKKMLWNEVPKLLTLSYIGNFLGAVLFAILIYFSGLFNDPAVNQFLLSVTERKMNAPWLELFFRGILCNWLVCLAFFIPMTMKNEAAKIFTMVLFVFGFFISGYEHSIANMSTFATSLIINHPETISLSGAIHNLIPVTIGNILGGSLFMGGFYYFINQTKEKDIKNTGTVLSPEKASSWKIHSAHSPSKH